MKFDYVIGNPPYQDESYGKNDFAPPIYNTFMDASYSIADRVLLVHPGRFLFNAGSTPKPWNQKMLDDEHFKIMHYEQDSSNVFSGTDIKGGIVISYRNATENFGAIQVFSQFSELNSIRKKVQSNQDNKSITSIIFVQNR